MRIVSIDIDPQGNRNRIHLGPFVAGLNAVFGERGSGKSTIAKFIRHLLYGRYRDRSGSDFRNTQEHIGSLQWADANGNSRVISSSDPLELNDYRFNAPYHWSTRHDWLSSDAINTLKPSEQPWHRIGGETFDAVFCGRLGETLPERLWAAARELGIAVRFDLEDDETHRRLRAEERRLQQRLHHLRVDDRDHAWWTSERRRLARRIEELQAHPEFNINEHNSTSTMVEGDARPSAQQWQSQLTELRSQLSSLQRQETEIARQAADTRFAIENYNSTPVSLNAEPRNPATSARRSTQVRNDSYGSWVGYVDRLEELDPNVANTSGSFTTTNAFESLSSLEKRLSDLDLKRAAIRTDIEGINRGILTLEHNLEHARLAKNVDATLSWEMEDLHKRLAYADEVLQSWALYEQTRARLVELQSQLRGHGPYRNGLESSFIKSIERYIRELSAGAMRGLPTWALEALRRDHSYVTGLSKNGRAESYREVYRDYRPDASAVDFVVPPSTSPERQIVELAIRMSIIEETSHRIGRLPLLLDDALDGFHGQQLDHIAQVLMQFARDGQQVLLLTSEEEVAQRVRHHQGWIARLSSDRGYEAVDKMIDRSIDERYWRNRYPAKTDWVAPAAAYNQSYQYRTSPAPVRPIAAYDYSEDINAMLASDATQYSDYVPDRYTTSATPVRVHRYYASQPVASEAASTAKMPRFFLAENSRIEDAPGVQGSIAARLRKLGINHVGQFIETDPTWIADSLGLVDLGANEVTAMQRAALLMCGVPQLRAFDARVLVGCGIDHPAMLAEMKPAHLLKRVESFLATDRGQAILRSGTSYELSRITTWIISARRSLRSGSSDRNRDRNRIRNRSRSSRDYDRAPRTHVREPREYQPRSYESAPYEAATRTTTTRTTRTPRPERTPVESTPRNGFVAASDSVRAVAPSQTRTASTKTTSTTYRFYLDLESAVVDAPSIGPRMAERLEPLGIQSVRNLLSASAATIVEQLSDKRFDEQTILDWQDQARLVCSVPNLRGHDAQILVACNVRSADALAMQDVDSLLAKATAFANSKLGQRLLRGAATPDRAEVTEWINMSRHSRSLKAA